MVSYFGNTQRNTKSKPEISRHAHYAHSWGYATLPPKWEEGQQDAAVQVEYIYLSVSSSVPSAPDNEELSQETSCCRRSDNAELAAASLHLRSTLNWPLRGNLIRLNLAWHLLDYV